MSFRLKTILGIAAIEIFLLTILVISSLNFLYASTEEQLLERARTTARLFSSMTSDAVVAMDLATLDTLVEETMKSPGVIYARVRQEGGIVLSESGDGKALAAAFLQDDSVESAQSDARLDIAHEIIVAGRVFGHVEVGIGTAALNATIASATQRMLGLAGAEILLVAIFGFLLGGMLTRQLKSIQVGARQVAEGHFGHKIEVRGRDELADTAKSFNRMSASLEAFASELTEARDRAETVLHDAVESVPQGILVIDENEQVLHQNSAFQGLYAEDAARLKSAVSLPDVTAITGRHVRTNCDSMQATRGGVCIEQSPEERLNEIREGAGKQWTLQLNDDRYIYQTVRAMQSGGCVIVETDVTPLYEAQEQNRKLELELLQASKMESLGTLAGGIAHEINTPIQYIGDNLSFLRESFDDLRGLIDAYDGLMADAKSAGTLSDQVDAVAEVRESADLDFLYEEIPQAAQQSIDGVAQVSRIVLAMKEFSHPSSKERAPIELNAIIERATIVCRAEWKHAANLDLQLDPDLPVMLGFEGELNQVILNMAVNAAHAIAEKGAGQGLITIRTAAMPGGVELSVTDTGTGIPDAVRRRIFDPFFTTKGVGKGTGQGLAICQDIVVNKHGGTIDIETESGEGTTFIMRFPDSTEGAAAPLPEQAEAV